MNRLASLRAVLDIHCLFFDMGERKITLTWQHLGIPKEMWVSWTRIVMAWREGRGVGKAVWNSKCVTSKGSRWLDVGQALFLNVYGPAQGLEVHKQAKRNKANI